MIILPQKAEMDSILSLAPARNASYHDADFPRAGFAEYYEMKRRRVLISP